MKKLRFAILHGLAQSGHGKTVTQIVSDAGFECTDSQVAVATRHLEMLGLIEALRRGTEIRAEVTPFGKEVLVAVA